MTRRSRRRQLPEPFVATVEGLSHEGRGICRHNGKTVFVFAALPGEVVRVRTEKTNRKYAEGRVEEVIEAAPERIEPHCPHFALCGGCSMQHVSSANQLQFKQRSVAEMMAHAGVSVGKWLPPLTSEPWGYRRRARLGVKYVRKKERLLVGFRERNKPYLADMQQCPVLIPEVGARLPELMELISSLRARETIPQIEVAADDEHCMLVVRHLEPLCAEDLKQLEDYAKRTGLWLQLQPHGPDSITPLYPAEQVLRFKPLPDSDIAIRFGAGDFTQVNAAINQQMVRQALDFLELQPQDRLLDLFCGLGNFTLPLAQRCATVCGVEGDPVMVARARENAEEHGINNTRYFVADLTQVDPDAPWLNETYNKVLLDPPRSGAFEIIAQVAAMQPGIIVYVSCQPSSLVRDAQVLCDKGYSLTHLGLMDMFPHTGHVESMAVFRHNGKK